MHSGYRILIVRGGDSATLAGDTGYGRDWFASQAAAAGASVEFVVAYQRLCPTLTEHERSMVQEAAVDGSVWLFSSSEAISNLVASCPGQSWQGARALATHPRIAVAVKEAGFAVVCESRPTVDALLASIESMQ
jgi:uroporphyrinogen-III synthase